MERLLDYAVSPAGPADALELGRVHVTSWRETYPGLLPQAYLNRMSPKVHARREQQRPGLAGPETNNHGAHGGTVAPWSGVYQ